MAADVLAPGFWEIGSYKHNVRRIKADTSISQDGAQKFRDRLEKTRDEVQRQKAIYERNLDEITQYR
uniref:Transposase n=1 Tax=Heterorhabditis bacteriophora TaxID=37862 RepID=A0A1I7WTY9_HETBA